MVSRERFGQGMTVPEYLDQMTMGKGRFVQVLEGLAVREVKEGRVRNVLVITEDWCGTALASFPALVRLVEGRPDVQVRVFLRDENPDLMDQFLKDGKYRSIPVIVFFDGAMNEVARFTERAPAGTDVVEHLKGLLEA
jgi:hypothetical protein